MVADWPLCTAHHGLGTLIPPAQHALLPEFTEQKSQHLGDCSELQPSFLLHNVYAVLICLKVDFVLSFTNPLLRPQWLFHFSFGLRQEHVLELPQAPWELLRFAEPKMLQGQTM
jgi:hypothetical protein